MLNKEMAITALKLFVITAVTAFCLAVVNMITKPIIAANSEKAQQEAQREILTAASEFEKVEASEKDIPKATENGVRIETANVGLKDGSTVGYVVTAISSEGYGGDIKVMVGVDADMKVTKAKILEAAETPGLGGNASKPEFIDQFNGLSGTINVVKNKAKKEDKKADAVSSASETADEGSAEISAISGATVTSRAVTNCVNAALEFVKNKGGNNDAAKNVEVINRKLEETKKITDEQVKNMKAEEGE